MKTKPRTSTPFWFWNTKLDITYLSKYFYLTWNIHKNFPKLLTGWFACVSMQCLRMFRCAGPTWASAGCLLLPSTLVFENWLIRLDQLARKLLGFAFLHIPKSQGWAEEHAAATSSFCVGAGNPNVGPRACPVFSLLTIFPGLQIIFCYV